MISSVAEWPYGAVRQRTGQLAVATAAGLLAFSLAVAAWGPGRTPAIALALPLLWALAPTRLAAAAVGFGYHTGVVRFLAELALPWFDSWAPTIISALSPGLAGALALGLTWTKTSSPPKLALATLAMLLVTLLPPLAVILPGHPVAAAGFLLPRWGWVGVAAVFLLSALVVVAVRVTARQRWPQARWIGSLAIASVVGITWYAGKTPNLEEGRLAGRVGAINTAWGNRAGNLQDVVGRIAKIGEATQHLAGGPDGLDTVIFPESVIGFYDPSLFPVLEIEVLRRTQKTGQTVVVGADVMSGPKLVHNSAIILRPDGSSTSVAARQTPPLAAWRPWSSKPHNPALWLAPSTAPIGGGVTARFVFCYEEYLTWLHLLSEAREDFQLVVAMSSLWSTTNPVANTVQAAHTEGIALLFGHRWVRSVNSPAPAAAGPH